MEKKVYDSIKLQRNKNNTLTFASQNKSGLKSIIIYPGITVLNNVQVSTILDAPRHKVVWDNLLRNGVHRIIEGKILDGEKVIMGDLVALPAGEAVAAIGKAGSSSLLKAQLAKEKKSNPRKSVVNALIDKIDSIEKENTAKAAARG